MIYEDYKMSFLQTQAFIVIKEIFDYWFDLIYGEGAKDLFEKELKSDNYNRQNW